MPSKVGLVTLMLAAAMLVSTSATSGATKQAPSTAQKAIVPSWAMHGKGRWVKDDSQPPVRWLAKVHGAAYVFYAIVKKIGIRVVLWKVHQRIVECHNGTYVTYFFRMRWPEIPPLPVIDHAFYINPWTFDGWVDAGMNCSQDNCYDPTPNQQVRFAFARGSFSACLLTRFLCIPGEQYGTVGQRIDGDGSYKQGTARG
jgi:hypothetical protein